MGGCPRRGQAPFQPLNASGPTILSVLKEDGFTLRVTVSPPFTSAAGIQVGAWASGENVAVDGGDATGATFSVVFDDPIMIGGPWTFTPPSGLVFPGGGDLPASSGIIS